MRQSILRSFGAALLVLGALLTAALGDFLAFCSHHRAWRRVVEEQSAVILDSGFGVSRPGDAIYACSTRHCFGLVICHDDLSCICAPSTLDASQVATRLAGACVVDQAYPSRGDQSGACRRARCDDHVDP